ncbi:M48 family metallopeptidase [Sphingomonas arantia]|uniref:M48 family metallopeptidase n=1 Tax=Sphingomonas arantia TaxID=1460676 RepID=A0ABW4TUC8_9SPHN
MVVHGYVTHAAANRRRFMRLFAGYLFGFELVGAFALTAILVFADPTHSILTNPAGYALRYALPMAALAALVFWRIYRGHAARVADLLDMRFVTRIEEPRFVAIAEEQCTALGVRVPRFGIVEAIEPNAMSFGEGPARGLIAVTRGLIDRLDDDELAAVLAHEASHIRNGDTKVLAANHALMRTALLFQTHNIFRVENWRQLWLPLILPPMLVLMLVGGAVTMLSLRYARWARRGVKLSRDYIADGESVRVTHHPDALITALEKVGGRGGFRNSFIVEPHLFDGSADHEGGSHPTMRDRIAAIDRLGVDLRDTERTRRDTRVAGGVRPPSFGCRDVAANGRFHFAFDAAGRPLEEPPTPNIKFLWLMLTDRPAYHRWEHACIAWAEWREDDRRNMFGVTPKMMLPIAAVATFLLVLHWPVDNDPRTLAHAFDPSTTVAWVERNVVSEIKNDFYGSGTVNGMPVAGDKNLSGRMADASSGEVVKSSSTTSTGDRVAGLVPFLFAAVILGVIFMRKQRFTGIFGVKPERPQDRGWLPVSTTAGGDSSGPLDGSLHASGSVMAPLRPPGDVPRKFGRRVG